MSQIIDLSLNTIVQANTRRGESVEEQRLYGTKIDLYTVKDWLLQYTNLILLVPGHRRLKLWRVNELLGNHVVKFLMMTVYGHSGNKIKHSKTLTTTTTGTYHCFLKCVGGGGGEIQPIIIFYFHSNFFMLPKKGGDNSILIHFFICKFKKISCCEKKWQVEGAGPLPPPLPRCYVLGQFSYLSYM